MPGTRHIIDAKLDGKVLRDVMRERLARLAAEVDRTRRDEGFKAALEAMQRFWWYSPFNQFVIGLQRPDAMLRSGEEAAGREALPAELSVLGASHPYCRQRNRCRERTLV